MSYTDPRKQQCQISDPHAAHHYYTGPGGSEYVYCNGVCAPRFLDSLQGKPARINGPYIEIEAIDDEMSTLVIGRTETGMQFQINGHMIDITMTQYKQLLQLMEALG